ncbi:ATP-binding protein [Bacillus andreraoultii]|uniref:ATP-binding protein n=1 Tax=Bacillus andreraoultii TaxID=1499685 RepID=UPI00053BBA8D|nr:ATP-binding protein [Bacillus andreraoultii]
MKWNSVVGKLWATILLLVAVVLVVLSLLGLQFFNSLIVERATDSLTNTASKIAVNLERHDDLEFGLEVAWELLDDVTEAIIITDENHVYYSNEDDKKRFPVTYFYNDKQFNTVFSKNQSVKKEINTPANHDENDQVLMVGVPLDKYSNKNGAVFIYQSLDVMNDTIKATNEIISWSAIIAFILTTVFAFFLSSRIAAPLRKMRESAAEVAKGKFDVKVPILTHDEIGELAVTFNQMRKQLKINMTALKQEKEQLSNILSSMADGVITFDKDGVIYLTNPPAEKLLKAWKKERGANTDEEIPLKLKDLINHAVTEGNKQIGEIDFQDKYWTVIVTPQFDEQSIRGAVAVLRDMTEERKLDKLREDFIANVSHELRTPISMLQGYSEALLDDIASSEQERKEIATVINEESLRMGRLVNELLDLARLESGQMRLYTENVEIKPYIERIAKKFTGIAKENKVVLQAQIETKYDDYIFDPDRIEQVLTNLVDNAIRHTEENGAVYISANSVDKGLQISVTDTGTGIPAEDLPFVFERFYKADKARTRGRSGTGLGLAIAKNIIDAHHGTIEVLSDIGQGTTFVFVLPDER